MRKDDYYSFPVEVSRDDFYLLEKLRDAGARISLRLSPADGGGLEVALGGASLDWPFSSEMDSSFDREFEHSRAAVAALFEIAKDAGGRSEPRPERQPEYKRHALQEYAEPSGEPRLQFFTLDLCQGKPVLEFFGTLAEAQAEVLRIAHRFGVDGDPEDVLAWMGENADVFWGRLMG